MFSTQADAGVVFNTSAGSDGDGPLAAKVEFVAVNGGIEVIVTNTETGTFAKGQAISVVSFMVNQALLSAPTAFTKLTGETFDPTSGHAWTLASGTAFSNTPTVALPNAIDHWGFQATASSVTLATAGSTVSGATGNPHYMILPGSGTAGPGSSLANSNFYPYIIGPADFFLTVAGVTSSTTLTSDMFSNVDVGFGTGPDKTLGTTPEIDHHNVGPTTPEPGSLIVWGGLGLLGLVYGRRRRKAA